MMKKPGSAAVALLAPVHLLLLAAIALPSLYVFWMSLNESTYGADPVFVGWRNYEVVLTDPYFWRAALNTFVVTNVVVYLEVAMGLGLALLFTSGLPFRKLMFAAVLMPYAVSEVVGVLAWKILMDPNYGVIGRTLADLGWGMNWSASPVQGLVLVSIISIWQHLPFTFLLLYAGLLSIPRAVYEAANIDGAGPVRTFCHVTLPLLVPTLLIVVIFRLIFAIRMFSEVWLLTKGGPARLTEVLSVYLYEGAFRNGEFGTAAATGWLMVVSSILVASFYLWQMQKRIASGNA
ncbi:MAG: sugar ABC transporter permease [Proteobacteria bacterium]|nr:sugar ABC transporter permease [Pseudomonadota bacterium]